MARLNLSNIKESIKNKNLSWFKEYYDRNRQKIMVVFLCVAGVFLLFYWTNMAFNAKEKQYLAKADATYERLGKAAELAVQVRNSNTKIVKMNEGLASFIQNTCRACQLETKLVNLRNITNSPTMEHISMRLENLFYDEFIFFISKIEVYSNLSVRNVSFTRRYDNPKMIDATFEIVKEI